VAQGGERSTCRVAAARALRREARASTRRCHVSVHDGDASAAGRRAGRSAIGRSNITPGAIGRRLAPARAGCPEDKADGVPARICPGNRCESSACAR
jgi:hypothetical protein